eukprot:3061948-Lingulodinium_polyedra.AAC.1
MHALSSRGGKQETTTGIWPSGRPSGYFGSVYPRAGMFARERATPNNALYADNWAASHLEPPAKNAVAHNACNRRARAHTSTLQ